MQSGATGSGTSCIGAEDDFTWRISALAEQAIKVQQKKAARRQRREREREVSIGMEHELGTTAVGYALSGSIHERCSRIAGGPSCRVGNLWHERVVGIWVGEHGADGEKHLGDGEGWAPLVPENVEADAAVAVDVGVVNLVEKETLGGLKG